MGFIGCLLMLWAVFPFVKGSLDGAQHLGLGFYTMIKLLVGAFFISMALADLRGRN